VVSGFIVYPHEVTQRLELTQVDRPVVELGGVAVAPTLTGGVA
jgi:hypothetical protein